jgi:hypothetical protein
MKTYTEEDLREAFRSGVKLGDHQGKGNYYDRPLDEDEYIKSLEPKSEEVELIPFTYAYLKRKLDWTDFCDITGVSHYALNEGFVIEDTEIFKIEKELAIQSKLI